MFVCLFVCLLFVCLCAFFYWKVIITLTLVSTLHRCCSCNCCLATGCCPLLLCLAEMFVVNRDEGGRERGRTRERWDGRGEAGKKQRSRKRRREERTESYKVKVRSSDLHIKSIIIQNTALCVLLATPPPDSGLTLP